MLRSPAGLVLALLLTPLPALAAAQNGPQTGATAVVLDNAHELRQGYCQGTVSGHSGATTTVSIEACDDGGIAGVAPGQAHAFPNADVLGAEQGLAVAAARKRFFASPRVAGMLRGIAMPAAGKEMTALATLAGQARLPDWQAFIGMLQPVAELGRALHHKPIAAYGADDFRQASLAFDRYAKAEKAAIASYATALGRLHVPAPRRGPGLAAGVLVQAAMRDYDLPFSPAMPDAWLRLQQHAARTGADILATYRRTMTPLGLTPFFVSELRKREQMAARIRQQAERTYAKAARQAALGVLTDAEYAKPDAAILADVERALAPFSRGRAAAMAAVKTQMAQDRKLIAITERIMAAMHGRHWRLTIAETDGDPPLHYTVAFTRTGVHALAARVYIRDIQTGKPIFMYTWPVYVQKDGSVHVNSAVTALENAFSIPATAFAQGRFRVKSDGFSEIFIASGELVPDSGAHRAP